MGEGLLGDRVDDHSAGGGQHLARTRGQRLQHDGLLEGAVRRLASFLPQIPDGAARAAGDLIVDVHQGQTEARADDLTDGALARAHEPDERDVA